MAERSTTTPAAAAAPERDRLLATKLHIPRPRPGFLARPRLLERLAQGTTGALILVCAPAGFGKTSLLGDWARRGQRPVAWLSLDGGDSDPARFWRYVATALDRARPGVRERVEALFKGGQPPLEAVVTVVVNELVEGPSRSCWSWTTTTWSRRHRSMTAWRSCWSASPRSCGWCWPAAPTRPCRWPGCGPAVS